VRDELGNGSNIALLHTIHGAKYLCIIILTFFTIGFHIGWVERLFAKPIIPHEVDGLI